MYVLIIVVSVLSSAIPVVLLRKILEGLTAWSSAMKSQTNPVLWVLS